jgi:hypothetical protein
LAIEARGDENRRLFRSAATRVSVIIGGGATETRVRPGSVLLLLANRGIGGVSDMAASDEYRSNAESCLRMARTVHNLQDKPFWLTLAQSWLQLAEQSARGDGEIEQSRQSMGLH